MKVRLTRSSNWSYVREEKSARLVGLADRRQQLLVLRRGPDVELKLEVCVCVCVGFNGITTRKYARASKAQPCTANSVV